MVNAHHQYKWRNLVFMVICWISTCYSYFIFVYLIKYLPADIYIVDLVSGFSAIGFLIQGPLLKTLKHKTTQLLSYSLVLVTLLIIIFF